MKPEPKILERKLNLFAHLILGFGKDCYRDFSWRKELDNPYKIICTEILLQKTSAEKVEAIYHEFFRKFPNEKVLSNSKIEEVVEMIRPTGLYNKKSKCLIDTASWIEKNGLNEHNILKLKSEVKGISYYAINAVSCFCFGKNVPLIDVNVKRIVQLFFGSIDDPESILLKSTSKLSSYQIKKFYFGIIDLSSNIRSKKYNPLNEVVVIITIDEKSYQNLRKKGYYWRFRNYELKRKVNFLVFYRKSPIKAITVMGQIKKIERNESFTIYKMDSLFEINPPINLVKGEYPAVSYKFSTINDLINANSYADA